MRARGVLLLLWLGATTCAWAQPDLGAAQTRASEAEQAYVAGDYATAIQGYREALDLGLDHAVVHYNLGNSYFKHGDIGRAIASYQRAQRRAPRDAEVRANLGHARSFQRDEGLGLAVPVFVKPLQFIYDRLSLNEWAALGLSAVALLALMAILGQWGIAPRVLRRRLGWTAAALAVACLLATGLRYRAEIVRVSAVVVTEEVGVRSGPGDEYNLTFQIHEGLTVYVAQQRDQWWQINLGGEFVGWVPAADLELL